jgi:hypothetical protein
MGLRAWIVLVFVSMLASVYSPAYGQRGDYIDLIRPDIRPPLVSTASEADSLWGHLEESDRADGIAESRRSTLETLVRRFTPTIVLAGNDYVEVEGRKYRLTSIDARLFADTLRVDKFQAAPYAFHDFLDIPFRELSPESLVQLVETAANYQSSPDAVSTWYFDFPGDNPQEWWDAYGKIRTGPDSSAWAKPTVYAHPFVNEGGTLIIQYWYCYPFNDFIGNHEGDWEHVNVVLTPDHESVAAVEYFFHAKSITLPQGEYKPDIEDETHPVAHAGGRVYNILDYPIRLFSGDRNEGSHGHYPYPGEWEGASGLGHPESVTKPGSDSSRVISWEQFNVILTPEPGRVDYKRKPEVLSQWAWLLLPVRWGYPSAPSLGSQIKLVDMGNRSPFGLAYSSGFNRSAPTLLFPTYQVKRVSGLRSTIEDLLQPWYYPYMFRKPRYVDDARGTVDREILEKVGLAPRGGWSERGFGTTLLGVHLSVPLNEFGDAFSNSLGISLWRNFWAKYRIGAFELLGGYQKFSRAGNKRGSLFVYPITANVVIRAPDALVRPWVSLGGGFYGWEARLPVATGKAQLVESGWSGGWLVGIGLEYYLRPKVAFDFGIRYHSTTGPGDRAAIESNDLHFLTFWFGHYLRF